MHNSLFENLIKEMGYFELIIQVFLDNDYFELEFTIYYLNRYLKYSRIQ